jgi:RNA polymerase sigma-70 factor (ECF subfamily)
LDAPEPVHSAPARAEVDERSAAPVVNDAASPTTADEESVRDVAALVARARRGERDAFAAFHARFARFVHAVLLVHAPRDDVEDLHQEVFVVAWRKLATLREDERASAWLATIARHAAQRRRAGRVDHAPLPAQLEDRSAAPRGALDGARLVEILRTLPEAYRETLALRLIEGFDGREIAAATGLTHGSVRVNLHRGMQLLREKLREEGFA